ncbi:YjgN family protein [Ideonella sp. DXS22W]|uniref:YjgN family protein n=1 Tax=Pseudaquabacterium inlustre TaxID=2984192 RepID=A0ABU9CII6_9BURK
MDFHAARMAPGWTSPSDLSAPSAPATRQLALRFTGSGSEYLRIWIVNLLLTLVTLTLYAPFAKLRRLRWQYANTLVDGQPLGFHGDAWKMLRGHLLILVFAGVYLAAGRFSATAGLLASAALAALWPALWQASLRFRLANTSWRGVRLQFTGSLGEAYAAVAPMLLPAALALASFVRPAEPGTEAPWWLALAPLATGLLWPWVAFRMKRYQHAHYHWAGQTTRLDTTAGAFYGVNFRAGMVVVLPVFLVGVVAAILLPALSSHKQPAHTGAVVFIGLMGMIALGYVTALIFGQAYLLARMQNLIWGHTRSDKLRFLSALEVRPVMAQLARNLVFTALTLGLYWPFGWVRLTALRLGSLQIEASEDPALWVAGTAPSAGSAVGDAAGDLLDIDVGL